MPCFRNCGYSHSGSKPNMRYTLLKYTLIKYTLIIYNQQVALFPSSDFKEMKARLNYLKGVRSYDAPSLQDAPETERGQEVRRQSTVPLPRQPVSGKFRGPDVPDFPAERRSFSPSSGRAATHPLFAISCHCGRHRTGVHFSVFSVSFFLRICRMGQGFPCSSMSERTVTSKPMCS